MSEQKTIDIKYWIHTAIVFLLMFGFPMLPTIEPLTELGMHVTGIFLGCLYGWTMVSVVWPSLLGLLALGFSGFNSMTGTFAAAYGGDTYLFVFFMLSFAALITKAGVTDYIAKWVISRKFSKGKPWVVAFLVYTAAFVVGALVSVMPSICICWTLTYQICAAYGYTNKDLYPKLMVIGVVNAALMGHSVFPFKALNVMMTNILTQQMGITIDFAIYTVFAFILGFGTVLIWLALCMFVYKPDVTKAVNSTYVYENTEKLNGYQKAVLAMLGLLVFAMFIPGFLPECALKAFLTKLGNTGIVVMFLMICSMIMIKGKSFGDVPSMIKDGVPWPTMILLATAMTIASAINADTGIKALFAEFLSPILAGHGVLLFAALVIAFGIILTNIINNVVVGMILMPIVCTFATTMGFSPEFLTVAMGLLLNITFLLPSGSPIAAFLHGNSEWVSSIEIQKYSIAFIFLTIVWFVFICLTVGNLLW